MNSHTELVVALFDVLGFEDRIGRVPLEQLHQQYRELLAIADSKGSHVFMDARPAGDGTAVPFLAYIDIQKDYFSDTILLWTPLGPATMKPFLHVCCRFLCEALKAELPMRGALAVGEAVMDKPTRTYLGQPLVEAARVEKAQQWIGISFGRSFSSRRDIPLSAELVRPYAKHRKPGYSELVLEAALDWPRVWRDTIGGSAVPALERLSQAGNAREYYAHTIEFVKHCDADPEWYKTYADPKEHPAERGRPTSR